MKYRRLFISIVILSAPASIAFSISSFTAAAGRSTTSPAAILFATSGGRTLMFSYYHRLISKLFVPLHAAYTKHSWLQWCQCVKFSVSKLFYKFVLLIRTERKLRLHLGFFFLFGALILTVSAAWTFCPSRDLTISFARFITSFLLLPGWQPPHRSCHRRRLL